MRTDVELMIYCGNTLLNKVSPNRTEGYPQQDYEWNNPVTIIPNIDDKIELNFYEGPATTKQVLKKYKVISREFLPVEKGSYSNIRKCIVHVEEL